MMQLMLLTLVLAPLFPLGARTEAATADELALEKLNVEIAAAEDRGDRKWFETVLASELAFRRASGVVVGREQFLKDVKARPKSKTRIESIALQGKDLAVVTCVVTLKVDDHDAAFRNVRLFIRDKIGWKLLGWANERLANN